VLLLWFLAFLVIAPTVFVYFLIIKGMDRYEPEPIWLLSAVFFWGAVVATPDLHRDERDRRGGA
jgi:RsiW-degrading membrane proteinase PrsW (M82 family)